MNARAQTLQVLQQQIEQHTKMRVLLEQIARMTTPLDGFHGTVEEASEVMAALDDDRLCCDAEALYDIIRAARTILGEVK